MGSMVWGLAIFGEKVKSIERTVVWISMMILGLGGMTYFSAPSKMSQTSVSASSLMQPLIENIADGASVEGGNKITERLLDNDHEIQAQRETGSDDTVYFLGLKCRRRTLGLIAAMSNGMLGGSALVPMHFTQYGGLDYVISFATGAITMTFFGWVFRWLYNSYLKGSFREGWYALPSMHFKTLWLAGLTAGTLWSIGNIGNILSVTYLGEGIGMTVVQSAMMVSGFWGIIWYREIQGAQTILFWASSAAVTMISIYFLGREHTH